MNIHRSVSTPAVRGVTPTSATNGTRNTVDAVGSGNVYDYLTDADRELIFQATGRRVEPGFDPRKGGLTSIFAHQVATDRRLGVLAPGQDISAAYLRDGALRYEAAKTGFNPFSGPIMDKALAYVAAHSGGHVDVGA